MKVRVLLEHVYWTRAGLEGWATGRAWPAGRMELFLAGTVAGVGCSSPVGGASTARAPRPCRPPCLAI